MTNKPKDQLLQLVNLAIGDIQDEAASFIQESKENYDPNKDDIVTSADKRAQERYVSNLLTNFPDFGIIGEEDNLNILPLDPDHPIYFTVDPLDGTKAFARGQSFGVGTMIALVFGNEVQASFIGDVNTGEIFGYYGDEPVTHKRFGVEKTMKIDDSKQLSKVNALFDNPFDLFPEKLQKLGCSVKAGGLMKSYEVSGGSVGLLHSRLWKGEIGILFLLNGYDTPWDSTPIIGLNKKLGFKNLKIDQDGNVEVFEPELPKKVVKKNYVEFVVHESKVEEILTFLNQP